MTAQEREGMIVAIHLSGFDLYHPPKVRDRSRYSLVGPRIAAAGDQTFYEAVPKWATGNISCTVVQASWSDRWRPVNWRYVPDADVIAFFNVVSGRST